MTKVDMLAEPRAADLPAADSPADRVLTLIREQIDRIRFGSIALSIHDGRVVQLEIVEKKRLA
jgi:hypothetical protein